jgi:pimeloyl-ACP methyl ester carboxylesterase/flavin reductase (DIM6/NTAB) family NADH-FMN oxidoreductase RutF
MSSLDPALKAGFASETASVNGTTIHYVRGGSGPALLLLHGFPQDWYEWRKVMPRLSQRFTVVAVDLRGVGGSAAADAGYAAADLARDVHLLAEKLELGPAHVVGHDVGGWVAYAFARRFPQDTRTVAILETPVPGIEPWLNLNVDVPLWHGAFHMVPGLPEALVADRQAVYFRYFFDVGTKGDGVISDADVAHYADAYGDPARLRSAFEIYRAVPANMGFNAGQTGPIDVPLLLAGGEHVFGPVLESLAANLRASYGWADVEVRVVAGGQHYLVEEQPDEVAGLIESHAAKGEPKPAATSDSRQQGLAPAGIVGGMHQVVDLKVLYFGTPVVLISTRNADGTANLAPMSSAWWLDDQCMLGMNTGSQTTRNLVRERECVLNLPSAELVEAVDRLALLTGAAELTPHKAEKGYRCEPDKFGAAGLTALSSDLVAAPRAAECPIQLECELVSAVPFGIGTGATAHTVRVLRAHVEEQLIVPGTGHVSPLGWQPLIMKFCEFFGDGTQLQPSRLARAWDIPAPASFSREDVLCR